MLRIIEFTGRPTLLQSPTPSRAVVAYALYVIRHIKNPVTCSRAVHGTMKFTLFRPNHYLYYVNVMQLIDVQFKGTGPGLTRCLDM